MLLIFKDGYKVRVPYGYDVQEFLGVEFTEPLKGIEISYSEIAYVGTASQLSRVLKKNTYFIDHIVPLVSNFGAIKIVD